MNWFGRQASQPGPAADARAAGIRPNAETAALTRRLGTELQALRSAMDRVRPWYLLLGPPGGGKTTLLTAAGLRAAGTTVLSGVGPTRSCAWWHNDHVIVLDTPGRYVTHDVEPAADHAAWSGVTEFLRQSGPAAAPRGVLFAIPVADLAEEDTPRPTLVQAMQARTQELRDALGGTPPSNLIVTKLDQANGFGAFFAGLPLAERAASWHLSLARGLDSFPDQFANLVRRLERDLFERLDAERSIAGRAALMTFPGSFAALQRPLAALLSAQGTTTPRGIWFTAAPERSCFVADLFNDLVRQGASPVSRDMARRRLASLVMSVAGVLACGAYLWMARSDGLQRVDTMAEAVRSFDRLADSLPLDPVSNGDLRPIAPLLDEASAAAGASDIRPLFGVARPAELGSAGWALYRDALHRILLPRLLWQLEARIRESTGRPDVLYETTRIYLMLGGAGPLDKERVREWMRQDWAAVYPRDSALQAALQTHLDALLAAPLAAIPLQDDLIAQARQSFAKVSPAQRAYARIRLSAAARQVPPWRPSDALGPVGLTLFSRASGRPLSDPVPGFYTVNGFHSVLLPSLDSATQTVANESWVTGQRAGIQAGTIQRDIIRLYEIDYVQTWDTLLADLTITPMNSISQAAQDLYVLAAPQSPLRALLAGIARQLTLSRPLGGAPPAPVPGDDAPPGWEVDRRYAALRELVGNGRGAPIDQALRALNDMQQQFAKAAAAASGIAVLSGQPDPAPALRAEALRQPEPLARWLTTLASSGAALRAGGRP